MKLFALVVVFLAGVLGAYTLQEQVPLGEEIAPAIGVHFTLSYAVAAARHENGTVQDLVKMEGDAKYIELMSRWATTRESRGETCGILERQPTNLNLIWKCTSRKISRYARSLLGLPISHDVATLSSFLRLLRQSISDQLDAPVTSIAPAIFPLDQPQTEQFRAALEIAGLTSSRPWHPIRDRQALVFPDVNAAYAGLGYGLCENGTGYLECAIKMISMDYHKVLWINLDSYSFATSFSSLSHVYEEWGAANYDFHLELGHRNRPDLNGARTDYYRSIYQMIVTQLAQLSRPPGKMDMLSAPMTRVVLMGDYESYAEFYSMVMSALSNFRSAPMEIVRGDLERGIPGDRVAARGAAELGWRAGCWKREVELEEAADNSVNAL